MPKAISDNQIIDAALEVIVQYGYDGATTRQIATAAGINEVTLFRRFGNKQNLLKAVVEQEAAHFHAAGIEHSGDLEADLLRVVQFYHHIVQHRGRVIALLLSEVPRHPELMELLETPMSILGRVTDIIAHYQREGRLAEEPPVQAFTALVGSLMLSSVLGFARPDLVPETFDPHEHVRRYLQGRGR